MKVPIFLALLAAGPTLAFLPARGAEPAEPAPPAANVLPLTLDDAIERARAASPHLAELAALEQAAVADVDAADAERRPDTELTGYALRRSSVPEYSVQQPGRPPEVIFPSIENNFGARAGISQPIYSGGRIAAGRDAARGGREAAARDRDAGTNDLTLEVRHAYWRLVTARDAERVFTESLAVFEEHLKDAGNFVRFGLAAESDRLNVRVQRDRAELDRLRARSAADTEEANLVRLIGVPPGTRIEPTEPLLPPAEGVPDVESLVAEALAARPDRQALAARVEAAKARVGIEEAGRRPHLAARGGYDYARPNRAVVPPVDRWDGTWDVGVYASFRLFDGGRVDAAVARRRAEAAALEQRLRDLEERIRLEVTARRIDLETARAAIPVARSAMEAAAESRRASLEQYRAGVISSTDLLVVETAELRASLELTSSLSAAREAAAALDRALGR